MQASEEEDREVQAIVEMEFRWRLTAGHLPASAVAMSKSKGVERPLRWRATGLGRPGISRKRNRPAICLFSTSWGRRLWFDSRWFPLCDRRNTLFRQKRQRLRS